MRVDNILELEKRKQIYNFILQYPGLHHREISRRLHIPKTTLLYHLKHLRKAGLISEKNHGCFLRYFASTEIGTVDREVFAMLRKRVARNILFILAYYRFCTQTEIVKHLKEDCNIKKHPTTIAFHLDKLIEMGVIECVQNGRKKIYVGNYKIAQMLIDFVITHKLSFLGDKFRWHLHRLNKPAPNRLEKAEQVFYEVFPHPYHA